MLSNSASLEANRGKKGVPPPLWDVVKRDILIDRKGKINLKMMLLHFLRQGRLGKHVALSIVQNASGCLRAEPNLLTIDDTSITVVGDIRGQLYDLAKILSIGGMFSNSKKYLFLGNYADRTYFSCECILFLLAAKLNFPNSVFLLRGNHESRFMTHFFDFQEECLQKYDNQVYQAIMEAFDCLPLAAIVNKQFFCVHAGLSPDVSSVNHIQSIHRFREPPLRGAMCDLLWSDPFWDVENPSPISGGTKSNYYTPGNGPYGTKPAFLLNEEKGYGYLFNYLCVKHFLMANKLLCIIRSHEVQDEGYKLYRFNNASNFPCMVSVFSAPNYCDSLDNKGAIFHLEGENMGIKQFFSSPHPYVLPKYINGFQWSFPFLLDNLQNFITVVMN
ncbi:putative serine/threonine protein phosphatase 2B catalytic subunit A2 [Trypanosoma theileri]|uniref:Serine/threonine-protein phosphatase n=1 Tax=Trypanosoma theileri TaxID=67003 RepID=A0A1X0P7Q5_9TRYP|nr:putative serine/threonine protein phosphatase 2B catalytic subunit A2 [Trypanosoma theileri]ORC92977.1 putative serine/threonine protein phosphatase 2B catalytic subunit A2 [Trypanosoma theileri]